MSFDRPLLGTPMASPINPIADSQPDSVDGRSHRIISRDSNESLDAIIRTGLSSKHHELRTDEPRARFWCGAGSSSSNVSDSRDEIQITWSSASRKGSILFGLIACVAAVALLSLLFNLIQASVNGRWLEVVLAGVALALLSPLMWKNGVAALSLWRNPPAATIGFSNSVSVAASKDGREWPCVARENFTSDLRAVVTIAYRREHLSKLPFLSSQARAYISLLICEDGFCFPIACWVRKDQCLERAADVAAAVSALSRAPMQALDCSESITLFCDAPLG